MRSSHCFIFLVDLLASGSFVMHARKRRAIEARRTRVVAERHGKTRGDFKQVFIQALERANGGAAATRTSSEEKCARGGANDCYGFPGVMWLQRRGRTGAKAGEFNG